VIDIRGLEETQRALAKLEPAPTRKLLQKAATEGAKKLKPFVQAETPRRSGKMRKSISATQAKRERPSAIVKFRPRIAWYRHFVVQGTQAHRIRFPNQKADGVPKSQGNIEHPGAKANDVMGRAWNRGGDTSIKAVNKVIRDYLESI
jgi:hypothetical protein